MELRREDHGISREVWRSRPYLRWTTNDVEAIRQAYAGLSARGFMVRIARQSPGWIITRHAPPGMGLPSIYAEIRPDTAVRTGPPTKHYHGSGPPPETLSPRHVHSPHAMRDHIARDKAPDDHRGLNLGHIHEHEHTAKYVFPPAPKVDHRWRHEHSTYKRLELRAKHVEHWHGGADPPDIHEHVRSVKDRETSLAKRIDMHQLAFPLFADAKRVFFVIEGCPKADAVLSAGGAVFSVPSVTLWDAVELPAFAAHYLVGRTVVIVPDMDWIDNPLVITQARLCQTRLRRLGIIASVAAPPVGAGHKGIDDFLGADGKLTELDVIDRDPSPDLEAFVEDHAMRRDQARRGADVLQALSMHADHEGGIRIPLRSIARIMGTPVMRVARGLHDLEEFGAVAIDGDLASRRGWFSHQPEWKKPPIITITSTLRAIDQPPRKLGKDNAA